MNTTFSAILIPAEPSRPVEHIALKNFTGHIRYYLGSGHSALLLEDQVWWFAHRGERRGLPRNLRATRLGKRRGLPMGDDHIFGDMIITNP